MTITNLFKKLLFMTTTKLILSSLILSWYGNESFRNFIHCRNQIFHINSTILRQHFSPLDFKLFPLKVIMISQDQIDVDKIRSFLYCTWISPHIFLCQIIPVPILLSSDQIHQFHQSSVEVIKQIKIIKIRNVNKTILFR